LFAIPCRAVSTASKYERTGTQSGKLSATLDARAVEQGRTVTIIFDVAAGGTAQRFSVPPRRTGRPAERGTPEFIRITTVVLSFVGALWTFGFLHTH
jgi:hypothetical protein